MSGLIFDLSDARRVNPACHVDVRALVDEAAAAAAKSTASPSSEDALRGASVLPRAPVALGGDDAHNSTCDDPERPPTAVHWGGPHGAAAQGPQPHPKSAVHFAPPSDASATAQHFAPPSAAAGPIGSRTTDKFPDCVPTPSSLFWVFVGQVPFTITKQEMYTLFRRTFNVIIVAGYPQMEKARGRNRPQRQKGVWFIGLKSELARQQVLKFHHRCVLTPTKHLVFDTLEEAQLYGEWMREQEMLEDDPPVDPATTAAAAGGDATVPPLKRITTRPIVLETSEGPADFKVTNVQRERDSVEQAATHSALFMGSAFGAAQW